MQTRPDENRSKEEINEVDFKVEYLRKRIEVEHMLKKRLNRHDKKFDVCIFNEFNFY